MSYESNNGSVYYELSCGVPTDIGWNANSNNGSKYLYLSANDFILWGQEDVFIHPASNNGSQYYFYVCDKPTDVGWDANLNNGTKFYYASAFNCVSFCETEISGVSTLVYVINGNLLSLNGNILTP